MRFQLTETVSWQEYRKTVYVFQEATKKVYIFSDTARDFWMATLEYGSFETIVDQLCCQYGEDFRKDIENDLKYFLDDMLKYKIVQEVK